MDRSLQRYFITSHCSYRTYERTVEFGLSQISKAEVMLLPNKTLPIPADPEHYIIALSVFHQIHCLVSSTIFNA